MSIIAEAVRAGCKERRNPVLDIECGWPDCPCGTTANALETAARHAAEAATKAEREAWQPMESAPRDGTPVDLFFRFKDGTPYRRIECRSSRTNAWVDNRGKWITGRYYRDADGEECLDPDDVGPGAFKPYAWRPLPTPPEAK